MSGLQPDPARSEPVETASRVELTTTLYGELRKLAASRMAGQFGPQTLQATALVHEAWLRLGGDQQPNWANRAQFFASVAEAMRRILVDRARRRQRIRHGGKLKRVYLEDWNWERLEPSRAAANDEVMLLVHEALEQLQRVDPLSAQLVNLRYFAGLTFQEVKEVTGVSERTARRRLAFARAWLGREIRRALAA